MSYIDRAVMDLIKRGQISAFVTRDGSKIADITHADVNEHTISHADLGIPSNVVALLISFVRAGGTGAFNVRTKTAGSALNYTHYARGIFPIDDVGLFRYLLTQAGDDWDLYCFGYWTKGIVTD